MSTIVAKQLKITGLVQGVGFRPFVFRLANKHNLVGNIKNCGSHVELFVQGDKNNIANFLNDIQNFSPALANIKHLVKNEASPDLALKSFAIKKSDHHSQPQITHIKDYAVCDACLAEFNDPGNRRFHYAFISCTHCGPRYSILHCFPLDRENTGFSKFIPCDECVAEYTDPGNRRFHAQNISCPACGPGLSYLRNEKLTTGAIIDYCVSRLLKGEIVCIKGVSAYRLYCDASNEVAVHKLRALKRRPDKPFAIMYPDSDDFELLKNDLFIDAETVFFLQQATRPIVLIPQKHKTVLAKNIAPGLNTIGVMLPATGLEYLLLNRINRPLVATSANLSGGKIISEKLMVEEKLSHPDMSFIHHDLDIQNALDDSVFKANPFNKIVPVRLARGYAPYEYKLPFVLDEPILAFGAQNKNTLTLAWQDRAVISQHLGDMGHIEVWQSTLAQIAAFQKTFNVDVKRYLVDAHPAYTANQWLKNNSLVYTEILHHHAHASALFFEHQPSGPVLVFCWDGNGYGDDGTLWGGETFYGSPGNWLRVASVRPFKLPGGENAIKEPWRIAASLCWHVGQQYSGNQKQQQNLKQLWQADINCPLSSSIGRLFDAAAALLGLLDVVNYDGQAAMQLETVASSDTEDFISPEIRDEKFDWQSLLMLLQDTSLTVSYRAKVFHNSLAQLVLQQTILLSKKYEFRHVGFSGGVFQNNLLTALIRDLLNKQDYVVLLHNTLPANDGVISLGQVVEYGGCNATQSD